jgi:hypothetical protein
MTFLSRILITAAAVVAVTGSASAQTAPGLLNKLEVQRLVAANTPASHASLAKHFVALTETYKADAARYRALPTGFVGNPNHTSGIDSGARRARQADAAAELALNARAMAAYHQLLSLGSTARPPRVAVTFDSGFGAPAPTPAQLSQLEKSARTPTDQRVLEEYFLNAARAETARADAHAVMGQMQRAGATRGLNDPAAHCDRMVKLARAASTQATANAELHRQLANIG